MTVEQKQQEASLNTEKFMNVNLGYLTGTHSGANED